MSVVLTYFLGSYFFDGLVCREGQGVGCVILSPSNALFEICARLDFECTNNQVEYEALLNGLMLLRDMG